MNDAVNNQYIRRTVKGLFGGLTELCTAALRGYDHASSFHYNTFGIEHLFYEMMQIDLFTNRLKRAGGSPALFQRELVKSFRMHRASSGGMPGCTSIHSDVREVADKLLEEMETYPDRSAEEMMNFVIDALLLKVDGSATAEAAIIECGARRLIVEPESFTSTVDDDIDDIFSSPRYFEAEDTSAAVSEFIDDEMGFTPSHPTSFDSNGQTPSRGKGASLIQSMRESAEKANGSPYEPAKAAKPAEPSKTATGSAKTKDPLEGLLRNLTEEALAGQIDKVVGRDKEIDHVIACLKRRRKGSVLLYGEAGIGKTAIAEGVAIRLAEGGEGILDGRPVYELSVGSMVAGTRYRGDFEERTTALLAKMKDERAILFIDEIHMLVGAGAGVESGMGAANLFKPALARGEMTIIGATTSVEVRAIRRDGAMMRRFEPIMVREPTKEETIQILSGSVDAYMLHHNLSLGDGVIEAICNLTAKYQPEKRFPDKAFDLLDSACVVASEMLDLSVEGDDLPKLVVAHVETAADRARIRRPHMPNKDMLERVRVLELVLSDRVHGQSQAIGQFCAQVGEAVFDLRSSGMRCASILAGPDLTAKAELAKTFAQHMGLPLTVIDGQSLSGHDAHFMLLGSQSGIDHPGILTEASDRDPEMVFYIQNMKDMAPAAQRILEEVLKTGVVRNAEGRNLSFRSSWMIVSAHYDPEMTVSSFGFGQPSSNGQLALLEKELPKYVLDVTEAPIFLDRVSVPALRELVLQTIEEVEDSLRAMGLRLKISEDLIDEITSRDLAGKGIIDLTRATIMPMIARALIEDASRTEIVLEPVSSLIPEPEPSLVQG